MPHKLAATRSELFFTTCFRLFAWLENKKLNNPVKYAACVFPVSFLASLLLSSYIVDFIPKTTHSYVVTGTRAFISFVASIIIMIVFTRGLLPILSYAPQAIAMRELGLKRICHDPDDAINLTRYYASLHDKRQMVKVICISGRLLFREEYVDGKDTPLHKLAMEGKLEVIMPITNEENITIKERLKTYNADFAKSTGYDKPEVLLKEIAIGKDFLRHYHNIVYEHNVLCMWRVVLFSNSCLVQNYFPNTDGKESYKAPLFVFENKSNLVQADTYYATFQKMFDILKDRSAKLS